MGRENMEIEIVQISGRKCYIFRCGQGEKIIYWGVQSGKEKEIKKTAEKLYNIVGEMSFVLVAYEVENWNDAFSPWKALPVFGDTEFLGGAGDTLKWLLENVISSEKQFCNRLFLPQKRLLTGYSMAGLFSLWAFYKSDQFGGVASCSGSLWFPKWKEYISIYKPKSKGIVYLSLGKKEEKTRNAIMAQIGEMTKFQYEQLENDERIEHSILKYHPGGHFHEVESRIIQGIAWLITN